MKNGQNSRALREVSKLTNIKICSGFTFKEDCFDFLHQNKENIDYKKIHHDLRYELTYGFDDFIPTFLGEFYLNKNFPSEIDKNYFDIFFKLCVEFGIPILIKLNHFLTDENFIQNFIFFFDSNLSIAHPNINRKKIVFIYSNVKLNHFYSFNMIGKFRRFRVENE